MTRQFLNRDFGLWGAAALVVMLALHWVGNGPLFALDRWQRTTLGSAFPTTNTVLLVGLIAVPALLVMASVVVKPVAPVAPRTFGIAAPDAEPVIPVVTIRFRVLATLAAALAGAALLSLLPLAFMPRDDGPEQVVDLGRSASAAIPEGPVALSGVRPAAGELRQTLGIMGFGHVARYLPAVSANAPAGSRATVVVELRDDGLTFDPESLPAVFHGIARHNGLPAAVADELTHRGAIDTGDITVLFADDGADVRNAVRTALELLSVAILMGLFALWEWRRMERPAKD